MTFQNLVSASSRAPSSLVLTGSPQRGSQLAVAELALDDQQRWVFTRDGGLQNRASGLLISKLDDGLNGSPVIAAPDDRGRRSQAWAVADRADGRLSFESEASSGLAISVEDTREVTLRDWAALDSQRWTLRSAGQVDVFWIRNEGTGMVAAAASREVDAGVVVVDQRGAFDDELQLWFRYQPGAGSPFLLRCVASGFVATVAPDGAQRPVRLREQVLPAASPGQLWSLIM